MNELWTINETREREQAQAEANAREVADLRARGFTIFSWDDLTPVPGGDPWLTDPDGNLWRPSVGDPLNGHDTTGSAAALGRGMVVRTGAYGRQGEPPTLAVLQRQVEDRRAREAEAHRKTQAAREAKRKAAPPVTATRLAGRAPMTLREAGEVVAQAAGRMEVRGGRLVVHLPTDVMPGTLAAAALLYDAEAIVASCVKDKRQLPDVECTPNGALLA